MDPDRFRIKPNDYYDQDEDLSSLKPANNFQPDNNNSHHNKSSKKGLVLGLSLLVILAIIVGGAYFVFTHQVKSTKKVLTVKTVTASARVHASSSSVSKVPTTSYASSSYGATFSYPTTWKLVNNGPGSPLEVISPIENLINENGQKVPAEIILTLANQATTPSAFGNNSAAVLTSLRLNYRHASASQAASTYISFVQYPSTTVVGGLNAIYVTGNYGYQKYQLIPVSQVDQVDPLIYYSFVQCPSATSCPTASSKPLVISSTEWSDTNFSEPILNTIGSFNFN